MSGRQQLASRGRRPWAQCSVRSGAWRCQAALAPGPPVARMAVAGSSGSRKDPAARSSSLVTPSSPKRGVLVCINACLWRASAVNVLWGCLHGVDGAQMEGVQRVGTGALTLKPSKWPGVAVGALSNLQLIAALLKFADPGMPSEAKDMKRPCMRSRTQGRYSPSEWPACCRCVSCRKYCQGRRCQPSCRHGVRGSLTWSMHTSLRTAQLWNSKLDSLMAAGEHPGASHSSDSSRSGSGELTACRAASSAGHDPVPPAPVPLHRNRCCSSAVASAAVASTPIRPQRPLPVRMWAAGADRQPMKVSLSDEERPIQEVEGLLPVFQ